MPAATDRRERFRAMVEEARERQRLNPPPPMSDAQRATVARVLLRGESR